jgi:putative ABC transport system permease protein
VRVDSCHSPPKASTWMRPRLIAYLYSRRLRVHVVQELFAGIGVAIAVALVFGATVISESEAGSAGEVVHALVGSADLQLRARDSRGFQENLLSRVRRTAGVKTAAPLLEQMAVVRSARGTPVAIELLGVDSRLAQLNGLARRFSSIGPVPGIVAISNASAQAIHRAPSTIVGRSIAVDLHGRVTQLKVAAVLEPTDGALSQARVIVLPLRELQQLAGLQGRVTRIIIQSAKGRRVEASRRLLALARGRLIISPADEDLKLLHQALVPSEQANKLFAAISVLLGFLLAFNALLLTVPERRKTIAELRLLGVKASAIIQMVIAEALCLGGLSAAAGLLGGYLLSQSVFHQSSAYLAEAFTVGSNNVVGVAAVIFALVSGMLAVFLAAVLPLLDLRRRWASGMVDLEQGEPAGVLDRTTQIRLVVIVGVLVALASIAFIVQPALALPSVSLLAIATVAAVPLVCAGMSFALRWLNEHTRPHASLGVALKLARGITLRSIALAATGTLALFGSVALGGSRSNLMRGIGKFVNGYSADANIWVINPGDNQATMELALGDQPEKIKALPGVSDVQAFHGEFLQWGNRRIWLIARPPGAARRLLEGQVLEGNRSLAPVRLGEGGWIAVSKSIAEARHVNPGDTLTLPTPDGILPLKIAATITNLGWAPGAAIIDAADYMRAWDASRPTALGITLAPGADIGQARAKIVRELRGSGLEAITAQRLAARIDALAGEGLSRIGQIATLLLAASILAIGAAVITAIWQRRTTLAELALAGAKPTQLRRILWIEVGTILVAGCLTGTAGGIYGEVVLQRYLKEINGFPVADIAAGWQSLEGPLLVLIVVTLIGVIAGWHASQVHPTLTLEGS